MSRQNLDIGDTLPRRISWTTLLALLVGLTFFSPFFERQGAQWLSGEPTLLMAAESIAWDGDLRYSRDDFDRHVLTWLQEPSELALATGDSGRHWTYDVSPAAALWLAPFVRGWPTQGFAVGNCLLLLIVGVVVAIHWQRWRGVWGPLTLALCLAGSLVLGVLFVGDGALIFFAITLLAFTLLAYPAAENRLDWRAWLGGGLLALPVVATALHGWLAVAAWWMSDRRRRRPLLLAFFGVLMASWWMQSWDAGGGGPLDRQVFRTSSGFPLVDFEGPEDGRLAGWRPEVQVERPVHAQRVPTGLDLSTRAWALVDRLMGQRLGVLLFFPLVLPLLCRAWQVRSRRPVFWTSLAWLLTWVAVTPRDLEMGGLLWAGGVWLPVYGVLVASLGWRGSTEMSSATPAWRSWPWRIAVVLAVGLGLGTLPEIWRDPWRASTSWTQSTSQATETGFWPLETTQDRLLLGDRLQQGEYTWVQLDGATWVEVEPQRLILPVDHASEWLLASPRRLDEDGWERLRASWTVLGLSRSYGSDDVAVRQGLDIQLAVESTWPRRHRVGWTETPQWLYRLRLIPVVPTSHPKLAYLALQTTDARSPELD